MLYFHRALLLFFPSSTFSTPTPIGPRHGAMSRVDLGMLIRDSGTRMGHESVRPRPNVVALCLCVRVCVYVCVCARVCVCCKCMSVSHHFSRMTVPAYYHTHSVLT
jgi:hypothetical protein